jgi:phytoene/squalene synthetase
MEARVLEAVDELQTRIATLTERVTNLIEATDRVLSDHESRIRDLERHRWKTAGAVGAVMMVVVPVANALGRFLSERLAAH